MDFQLASQQNKEVVSKDVVPMEVQQTTQASSAANDQQKQVTKQELTVAIRKLIKQVDFKGLFLLSMIFSAENLSRSIENGRGDSRGRSRNRC